MVLQLIAHSTFSALTPSQDGGLGYSPKQYGELNMCASLVVLTLDLVLPSMALKVTGHVRGFSIGFIVLSIMVSFTWTTARMHNSKWTFAAMLLTFQ